MITHPLEHPAAWRLSAAEFLATLDVREPSPALSDVQRDRMSPETRAEHDRQRADAWRAASAARDEWRRQVFLAFDAGAFNLASDGLHPDARGVVQSEQAARAKVAFAQRLEELKTASRIWTVDDVQLGEPVWHSLFRAKVTVIRKHRVSVEVKGPRGIAQVKLADGVLWRRSHAELEAEARRPQAPSVAPAPGPADAPAIPASAIAAARAAAHEASSVIPAPMAPPARVPVPSVFRAAPPVPGPPSEPPAPPALQTIEQVRPMNDTTGNELQRMDLEFEGRQITAVRLRDQWWWPARYVGRAIEQADDGRQFVRNVTENTDDFVEGLEFLRVSGAELGTVRRTLSEGGLAPTSQEDSGIGDAAGRPMVLLSESGLNLALMRSKTELGKRMRLWLAREVIPSIRRTGSYAQPGGLVPAGNPGLLSVSALERVIVAAVSATVSACMESTRTMVHAEVESLRSELHETRPARQLSPPIGTIGTAEARQIMVRITRAAHSAAGAGAGPFRRLLKEYEDRLREHVRFPRERAHRWALLPVDRLGELQLALARLEREVGERVDVARAEAQGSLRLAGGAP